MIQLSGAGKRFGHKLLFENLNWLITPQDRVGLVGANGTGKTTLLKVLAGLDTLDYGGMSKTRGTTTGYLPQDGLTLAGRTVFEECLSVFADLQEMEREMERLNNSLAELDHTSAEYDQNAERLHRLQGEFQARDGYALEAQVGAVLTGLGFAKADWTRPTEEFSGGWQMRIALGKLLLSRPNLLLLDEPTNHLDLETRNWLEEFLASYPYAYVLVSHDRYFLDVTVRKTAELWNRSVHFYHGNYEQYLKLKTERQEQIEAAYRNQRDRIEQLEVFINRFRYQATKAKQVQSRIKELERMERIELPEAEHSIHFKFPQPDPSGRLVAEAKDVRKDYGPKMVFQGANFTISRGDRVALVGVNGAGKSTLLKILAQQEQPTEGELRLGHNARAEHFAQDQYKVLDPEARMLDDLWSLAPHYTQTDVRNLLGAFLFREDDVFKKLGVLSGGERNRYALARILLHPSNFLLLDEPTNHLDLRAKDVLLEALENYSGTVVFISHDRYFIDKLATRIFEIAEGAVHVFPGNYEDYRWRKEHPEGSDPVLAAAAARANQKPAPGAARGPAKASANAVDNGTKAAAAPPAKKPNAFKLRQLQERCAQLEQEVARAEADVAGYEQALVNFVSTEETLRLTELVGARRDQLEKLMAEWEQATSALDGQQG